MKKLHWVAVAMTLVLTAQPLGAQAFPSFGVIAYRVLLRAAYGDLQRFLTYLAPSKPGFRADGGSSDGGGSDGSGSSGDGSGSGAAGAAGSGATGAGGASSDGTGGSGDGTGTGDGDGSGTGDGDSSSDSASASDAASAAAAAASAAAATSTATDAATDAATATTTTTTTTTTDPGNAPDNNALSTDPVSVTPTNPTAIALSPIDAIQAEALTDPRGGSATEDFSDTGSVPEGITTIPPGGPAPTEPVDVEIHAVIISAAESPWDAVKREAGVRNVIVVGGIVALGQTPIPGEIPGGGPEPDWLRVIPDLSLLNGSKIPPVVPNVIDIRIMNCPVQIGPPPNQVEVPNS
jgi:hypothetical protein